VSDDDAIFSKLTELLKDELGIQNKHVCITGVLSRPRHEIETVIAQHGGIPQPRVTKLTDWLVVGGKPGGTKVTKAIQYGIPVVSEKDLWATLGGAV
jgi:NAD-dependent DNA ligase